MLPLLIAQLLIGHMTLSKNAVSKGGSPVAAGRQAGFGDYDKIVEFLWPFITSSECFTYTTDRSIKATNTDALLSEKYQNLSLQAHHPRIPPRGL